MLKQLFGVLVAAMVMAGCGNKQDPHPNTAETFDSSKYEAGLQKLREEQRRVAIKFVTERCHLWLDETRIPVTADMFAPAEWKGELLCDLNYTSDLLFIRELPEIRALSLYPKRLGEINDETVAEIVSLAASSQLESLKLGHAKVSDLGYEHLSKLTRLKTLMVFPPGSDPSPGITPKRMLSLAKLVQLESFHAGESWGTVVDDEALAALLSLKKLREIEFHGRLLTSAGWKLLESDRRPMAVNLSDQKIDPVVMQGLRGIPRLEYLRFWNTDVSSDIAKIGEGMKVKELSIASPPSNTVEAFPELAKWRIENLLIVQGGKKLTLLELNPFLDSPLLGMELRGGDSEIEKAVKKKFPNGIKRK